MHMLSLKCGFCDSRNSRDLHFIVSFYNHYFLLVYRHTAYSSPARRKSQSEEIISGETNEHMHSNSARDLMFYEKNPRTKTKI